MDDANDGADGRGGEGRQAGSGRRGRTAVLVGLVAVAVVALVAVLLTRPSGESRSTFRATAPEVTGPAAGSTSTDPPVGEATTVAGIPLRIEKIAQVQPQATAFAARPGTRQLYVTEQEGRVRRLDLGPEGAPGTTVKLEAVPVLDLSDRIDAGGERGLLGLTFSPDGNTLYVFSTGLDGAITIDELAIHGDRVDAASRRNLLTEPHDRGNHNSGQLAIGPDGLLYIGMGDGGGAGDPDDNGQNPRTIKGTILRIDPTPSTDRPYTVPPDNPYADGVDGAPEVWTWGLRNPWRFSFDTATGDLWIGDVGQDRYEEIDFLPAAPGGAGRGANLGWSEMEGSQPFEDGTAPPDAVPPLFDYGRDGGECTVIGGYVYRGSTIPELTGVYVYADLCREEIRGLLRLPDGSIEEGELGIAIEGGGITSFGQDLDGEVYVLAATGAVYRIAPA